MSTDFIHLHIHSEYSLLDGSIKIKKLVKELANQGFSAAALTDHDSLHGIIEFYSEAKGQLKPIIGYEPNIECILDPKHTGHLVLLAENNLGFSNISKISSYANTKGKTNEFGLSTAVPLAVLKEHSQGIICLTGCMKSELNQLVLEEKMVDALKYLHDLKSIFGDQNVFVELINNGLPQQQIIIPKLVNLARQTQLPIVASADVHYLKREQKEAHLSLLAIKHKMQQSDLNQIDRNYDFHLATKDEMKAKFGHLPEALNNTLVIAERCQVHIDTKSFYMPEIQASDSESSDEYMARLAREGLEKRKPIIEHYLGTNFNADSWQIYLDRLNFELDMIARMKFAGYFLIVQDYINWAKKEGIPVGPGRGSAAGSLVTYALGITNIDPIRFNLLFERFLNPERVSMPDIDTDFCQDRRGEVLNYVYERFGRENVGQIVTFGRLMARNAIKSLARIQGWSFHDSNLFAKLIPETPGVTLEDALKSEDALQQRLEADERASNLWSGALEIEGVLNSLGIHAAGVIISDKPLYERCPVMESEGQLLTQLEYKYAEKIGLIKFDFLGLKTLTVIEKAIQHIRKNKNPNFDIETIDLEDPKVYENISTAHVTGVFQLESPGMRKLIASLKPTTFSDIVAVLALFRPGPLGSGMVEDFVQRKHGKKAVEFALPQLEPILADTYGVMVYQEQIQKIAVVLANYTLGEADLLRRAMGKKDKNEMAKQKERFVSGSKNNGIDPDAASEIFDLMAKFAEYGFNKSHTVAYGLITYQTAYLKTYYPTEFMTAIMSCDLDDTDKIVTYVRDCQRMKIELLPPSVNYANYEFTIPRNNTIQFGLGAVKGLGKNMIELIVQERENAGKYQSVPEFLARVDSRKINKKVMESLVKCGAFDDIHSNRAEILENTESWMKTITSELHQADTVGDGIFASFEAKSTKTLLRAIRTQKTQPWSFLTKLEMEKSVLGFYLSGHPADFSREDILAFSNLKITDAPFVLEPDELPDFKRKSFKIAGVVTDVMERRNKDNEKFCSLKIHDGEAEIELTIFAKQYAALNRTFTTGETVWAECKIKRGIEEGSVRGTVQSIGRLSEKRLEAIKSLVLKFDEHVLEDSISVQRLKDTLSKYPGPTPVFVSVKVQAEKLALKAKIGQIEVSDAALYQLDEHWAEGLSVSRQF